MVLDAPKNSRQICSFFQVQIMSHPGCTVRTSHVIAVALVSLPVVGPVRMGGLEEVHVVVVVRTDHLGAVVVEHRACDVGLRFRIDLRWRQKCG